MTIIVRHDDEDEEASTHRSGAWKVAYADFVTAMMAFFMLMWLLNATTEVQRTGLADYFAPTNLFGRSASGSGKPFGGQTPNDSGTSVSSDGIPQVIKGHHSPQQDVEAADADTLATPLPQSDAATEGASQTTDDDTGDAASGDTNDASGDTGNAASGDTGNAASGDTNDAASGDATEPGRASRDGPNAGVALQPGHGQQAVVQGGDYAAARLTPEPNRKIPTDPTAPDVARSRAAAIQSDGDREQQAMEQAGAQLLAAIRNDPSLQDAAGQIMVDTVPQGLRIQVLDAEHRPMFALGSASPTKQVRELMQKVAPVLAGLPNEISIAGHTDSLSYRGQEKDNWELSTDRANATRRILVEAGLSDKRIRSVTGNADRDLLVPADPLNPANRRITIIVLRHAGGARPAPPVTATRAPATAAPATPAPAAPVTAAPAAAAPASPIPTAAVPVIPAPAATNPVK